MQQYQNIKGHFPLTSPHWQTPQVNSATFIYVTKSPAGDVLSIKGNTDNAGDTSLPVGWKAPNINRFILLKIGNAHHHVCHFSCSLQTNINLDKNIPLDHKLTTDQKCHYNVHIIQQSILILELKLTFFSETEKEKDIVWSN